MSDRYGQTRIGKIKAAYDDLRAAVRSHNVEGSEAALDRYEQWGDYVFAPPDERADLYTAAIARAERAEAERDALARALISAEALEKAVLAEAGAREMALIRGGTVELHEWSHARTKMHDLAHAFRAAVEGKG
jgi:hypothetical protein